MQTEVNKMSEATIRALDFTVQDEKLVDSAERLAGAITDSLGEHDRVVVSLKGLRGVSSSYFNVILRNLVSSIDLVAVEERVKFQFDSLAQEMVYQRSLLSFREEGAVA